MAESRRCEVMCKEYDLPDSKTVNGMAEFFGNYASYGGKVNVARGFGIVKEIYWHLGNLFCQKDLTKIIVESVWIDFISYIFLLY
jgi:hypothetical protein